MEGAKGWFVRVDGCFRWVTAELQVGSWGARSNEGFGEFWFGECIAPAGAGYLVHCLGKCYPLPIYCPLAVGCCPLLAARNFPILLCSGTRRMGGNQSQRGPGGEGGMRPKHSVLMISSVLRLPLLDEPDLSHAFPMCCSTAYWLPESKSGQIPRASLGWAWLHGRSRAVALDRQPSFGM